MADEIFNRCLVIWKAVHDLVDDAVKDLPENDAEDIRERLTNEFRFGKRHADT